MTVPGEDGKDFKEEVTYVKVQKDQNQGLQVPPRK